MMKLEMLLNDSEAAKLEALAKARGKTPEQCVRDFIAACCPGGSGWVYPGNETKVKARS